MPKGIPVACACGLTHSSRSEAAGCASALAEVLDRMDPFSALDGTPAGRLPGIARRRRMWRRVHRPIDAPAAIWRAVRGIREWCEVRMEEEYELERVKKRIRTLVRLGGDSYEWRADVVSWRRHLVLVRQEDLRRIGDALCGKVLVPTCRRRTGPGQSQAPHRRCAECQKLSTQAAESTRLEGTNGV